MILRPVLAPLPSNLTGRDGVDRGRRAGRLCLTFAAREAGLPLARFARNEAGAPLPIEGGGAPHHWSLTNTAGLSAAVVAPTPVGIDVESLDRPRVAPLEAFADAEEAAQLGADDVEARLSLWTAKEAVLKKTGVGIADLRVCRLAAAPDLADPQAGVLVLEHDGRRHTVLRVRHGRHLLALTADAEEFRVEPLALEPEAVR